MINSGTAMNAASAMNAFATGVHGTAYNIANISTGGFQPVSVRYQSGPNEQGVTPIVTRAKPPTNTADNVTISTKMGISNVDPAREMVNLTTNQRAFEANSTVIRASDEMIGTLIDIRV